MKKMKKVLFISAIVSSLLVSCKKDYTCVCTINVLGTTVSVTTEAKSSKKGATAWCKSLENPTETVNGSASTTFPLTCAIK
jgi:hypothetical protein